MQAAVRKYSGFWFSEPNKRIVSYFREGAKTASIALLRSFAIRKYCLQLRVAR